MQTELPVLGKPKSYEESHVQVVWSKHKRFQMMYPFCMLRGRGYHLAPFGELMSWGGVDGDAMGVGERVRELAQIQKCLGVALSTISRCEYSFSFCCVVG